MCIKIAGEYMQMTDEIRRSDYVIFLNEMEEKLHAYYDVVRDYPIDNETFDLYAEYKESVEDYFIMSMLKIYMYHVFAHILFKKLDTVSKADVEKWFEWMKTIGKKHLLKIPQDHYLTVMSLVIVAPHIDEEAGEAFKKAFLTKAITFRLRGSYDIALIGYDWNADKLYYAKESDEIVHSIFPEHFKSKSEGRR
jgi:hypothetical protein